MGLLRLFKKKTTGDSSSLRRIETDSDESISKFSVGVDVVCSSSSSSSSSGISSDQDESERTNTRLAIFSLSSSSSCSSICSIDEDIHPSQLMTTRIIPVGFYRDKDQQNSSKESNEKSVASSSSSASSNARFRPFDTEKLDSTASTASATALAPPNSSSVPIPIRTSSTDSLTIEQNLFNMVRFEQVKNNFNDYYQLGNFVRSGGFSDIHEGIRLSDKKPVIVKFIPKDKTKNWLMISQKKYPAEILLHKAVHEIQGIIHVYDYFENAQHWILVMERLRNCQDLFDYLEAEDRGRLTEAKAKKFFQQLVQINIAMLRKGVVHRDLKSENILVDLDSHSLVLIDFGASAIYKSSSTYYSDFHGTKQYKSPEYILKKRYAGVSSTVWTLGVLLYDMVCGCLPFENEEEITGYKLALKSHLSPELKNLIQRCLAPNPDRRPSLESLLEHAWLKDQ